MSYNKKAIAEALSKLNKARKPKQVNDIIMDPEGQNKFPGLPTRIPSDNITMETTPYPVLGIDNLGNQQMMYPGANYLFPGADYVDEYPMAQYGGLVTGLTNTKGNLLMNSKGKRMMAKSGSLYATNKLFLGNPLLTKRKKAVFVPGHDFQSGGQRPILYVDPNDPEGVARYEAYQDSAALYNNYIDYRNMALNTNAGTRAQIARRYSMFPAYSDATEFNLGVMNPSRQIAFNTNNINPQILPIAGWAASDESVARTQPEILAEYKKPTTTVKYRDPKIVAKQQQLIDAGYKIGKADGIWGDKSKAAWKEFKKAQTTEPEIILEQTPTLEVAPLGNTPQQLVQEDQPQTPLIPEGYNVWTHNGQPLDPQIYGYAPSTSGPRQISQFASTHALKRANEAYTKLNATPWATEGNKLLTDLSKPYFTKTAATNALAQTAEQLGVPVEQLRIEKAPKGYMGYIIIQTLSEQRYGGTFQSGGATDWKSRIASTLNYQKGGQKDKWGRSPESKWYGFDENSKTFTKKDEWGRNPGSDWYGFDPERKQYTLGNKAPKTPIKSQKNYFEQGLNQMVNNQPSSETVDQSRGMPADYMYKLDIKLKKAAEEKEQAEQIEKKLKKTKKEVSKFYKEYMDSPMYKEMLGDESYIDRKRRENLGEGWFNTEPKLYIKHAQPSNKPNTGGYSRTSTGNVTILPQGHNVKGIIPHELSHSMDRPRFEGISILSGFPRLIPQKDIDYINKVTIKDKDLLKLPRHQNSRFVDYPMNVIKQYYPEWLESEIKWKNYMAEPTEVRARLNDIRFQSKKRNLYDPFTQKVTPEIYEILKNTKFEEGEQEGFDPLKQLKGIYTDEQIMYMLNNISQNTPLDNTDNAEDNFVAKLGGFVKAQTKGKNNKLLQQGGITDWKTKIASAINFQKGGQKDKWGREENSKWYGFDSNKKQFTKKDAWGRSPGSEWYGFDPEKKKYTLGDKAPKTPIKPQKNYFEQGLNQMANNQPSSETVDRGRPSIEKQMEAKDRVEQARQERNRAAMAHPNMYADNRSEEQRQRDQEAALQLTDPTGWNQVKNMLQAPLFQVGNFWDYASGGDDWKQAQQDYNLTQMNPYVSGSEKALNFASTAAGLTGEGLITGMDIIDGYALAKAIPGSGKYIKNLFSTKTPQQLPGSPNIPSIDDVGRGLTNTEPIYRGVYINDEIRQLPKFKGKTDEEILDIMGTTIPGNTGTRRKGQLNQTLNFGRDYDSALEHIGKHTDASSIQRLGNTEDLTSGKMYVLKVQPDKLSFLSAKQQKKLYEETIAAWKKNNPDAGFILGDDAKNLNPEILRQFGESSVYRTEGENVFTGNFPQFVGKENTKIGKLLESKEVTRQDYLNYIENLRKNSKPVNKDIFKLKPTSSNKYKPVEVPGQLPGSRVASSVDDVGRKGVKNFSKTIKKNEDVFQPLTREDIIDRIEKLTEIVNKNKEYINSDYYINLRSKNTGETREHILKEIEKYNKRAEDFTLDLNNNKYNYLGYYNSKKNLINISPSKFKSFERMLETFDHEVKHMFSPLGISYKPYNQYPRVLKKQSYIQEIKDMFSTNSEASYYRNIHEQQVRNLRFREAIQKDLGLPLNQELTRKNFNKWLDNIEGETLVDKLNNSKTLGSLKEDVKAMFLHVHKNPDVRRKIINSTEFKNELFEILKNSWALIPATIATGAASQFQQGGTTEEELTPAQLAMMKARLAYAHMHGNPSAQRMVAPVDNPYIFTGNEPYASPDTAGYSGTHYMFSQGPFAVPTIQTSPDGQLYYNVNASPNDSEAMQFDSPEDAEVFARYYKTVAPAFQDMELTDEEIEEYKKGGCTIVKL